MTKHNSVYVRIGSDYVKFSKNNEYTLTNSSQATVFNSKSEAAKACRAAGLSSFKLSASNTVRRF